MHISNRTLPQSRLSKNATQAPQAPLRRFNPNSEIRNPKSAFTLLELLIAIGIIVLLVGILIPTVGKVRTAAKQADTRAQIAAIAAACENYYADFRAYPGPFSNQQLADNSFPNPVGGNLFAPIFYALGDATIFPGTTAVSFPFSATGSITSGENLVLGLLGGLVTDSSFSPPRLIYNATLVGKGANGLNPSNPKRVSTYMDSTNLSLRIDDNAGGSLKTGKWGDESLPLVNSSTPAPFGPGLNYISGGAGDSIIPEFVDRYSDPMPILYLRASVGRSSSANPETDADNSVITDHSNSETNGQYDVSQLLPYTGAFNNSGALDSSAVPAVTTRSLGTGKKAPKYVVNGSIGTQPARPYHGLRTINVDAPATSRAEADVYYPLPAFPYLRNASLSNTAPNTRPNIARNKDSFILISAGTDRIYGTADDITNFGDVLP